MKPRTAAAAGCAMLALAGCGGGAKPAGPPSARALALRIPGCIAADLSPGSSTFGPAPADIRADVECNGPQADVEIVTFNTESLERNWLNAGGTYPNAFGMDLEGRLWVASVRSPGTSTAPTEPFIRMVQAHIGGKQINGG